MGGVIGGLMVPANALPLNGRNAMELEADMVAVPKVALARNSAVLAKDEERGPGSAPRVRSYFPEALYINPEIITDGDGRASISIPLADSITTWRMAMLASTVHGALGSATSSLKVFQDFLLISTCQSRLPRATGFLFRWRSTTIRVLVKASV